MFDKLGYRRVAGRFAAAGGKFPAPQETKLSLIVAPTTLALAFVMW